MTVFKLIKIEENKPESTITLSDIDMDIIYNALNEYQDNDEVDAISIMDKIYELYSGAV